jgi:DNA-binding transcriptional ArsR family regulator
MNAARTDLVFTALAHRARRRMLDLLMQAPGMSVAAMASHFEFSRIAVMKHLRVLEQAGLLSSERDGRTRRLFLDPTPIQAIYDRWTTQLSAFWITHMADIKARVEARAQRKESERA